MRIHILPIIASAFSPEFQMQTFTVLRNRGSLQITEHQLSFFTLMAITAPLIHDKLALEFVS